MQMKLPKGNNRHKEVANINSVKLKEEIKKAGYTQVRLAEELEITQNSLSSKITGKSEFTLSEAIKICECLNITDINKRAELFLR